MCTQTCLQDWRGLKIDDSSTAAVHTLQHALASSLSLQRCTACPTAAAAAADLLAVAFEEHASMVAFLLLPTALELPGSGTPAVRTWRACSLEH
jgi:hypothetical protein